MCGIAGIVGRAVNQGAILSGMLNSLAHRGPDGSGAVSLDVPAGRRLSLGHRRLAILDLSQAAAQPMADVTGQFVLTFNGEIYNYLEIRAELMAAGATFRSSSDTEVVLEAYKRWGTDCLEHFNGMFAFALYDARRKVLFCARDRYGEKPFLYSISPDLFVFASEYKALLTYPAIPLDIDEWRLLRGVHNASTALDADRQTVFVAVQQLLHGEAMEVDVATLRTRVWRYWEIKPEPTAEVANEADVFAEFRDLLTDAVRLRLRSDVTVGSCLSGGLDSSAIVCLVRRLLGADHPYQTFTGRFPGTPADEWQHAERVIASTHVQSHVVEPRVERFIESLPEFMWHNELPVGSSSQFAQWSVFGLAKQHRVTVLLDGQGADETLGGYEQYFGPYVQSLRDREDFSRLRRELPLIRERYPLALAPARRAWRDQVPFRSRHWLSNRFGVGTSHLYGLRREVAEACVRESALPRKAHFHALANSLEQDTFGRYLTALLRYGDRNSMAHSREVRLPFCDHRLAEFVFRLPPQMLMGEVQTKRLLRESMKGILPESIRTRWNKQGFRPPQDQWFRSPPFVALVEDTITSRAFRESPFWVADWWMKAVAKAKRKHSALGWTIWHPFIVEQWRVHFLERLRASRSARLAAAASC